MKKVIASLCAFAMLFSMSISAFAADTQQVVDCGDGFYMVITTNTATSLTRASSVEATKDATVYNGSTAIGDITLVGNFDYTGSSAKATSGSTSGSGSNGWSYKSGSASCSGAKVTGSFKLASGLTSKTFTLTLTCSPNGTVS